MANKSIMVVDDSPSFRQVLKITLNEAGYDVIEACDGKDALAKLNGVAVNLLICDLAMPNMDGMDFLRALKQLPDYRFTPVLVLTTNTSAEKKKECREMGVKAWVNKPFQPEQILAAVAKLAKS
jgi:two-component system, chemotaxis family, chemotaxis protein CheY